MDNSREVVITGMGVICPVGLNQTDFAQALDSQQSGVGSLAAFDAKYLPAPFGGEISDFDPKKFVRPRKSLKLMSRLIQIAFASADLAMQQADIAQGSIEPERLGVVLGSEMIYGNLEDLNEAYNKCYQDGAFNFDFWGEKAINDIQPLWMLKYLPNMPACHVAISQDARGPNNSVTMGEVSPLMAMQEAYEAIRRGAADVMITGAVGSRLSPTSLVWRGDALLSHHSDDPTRACRPFDSGRDGIVNGEGTAAFVLETRENAIARGAKILASIASCACGFEKPVDNKPLEGLAIRRSIRLALERAEMKPSDVGHVNAHGLSTIEEDVVEACAIRDELGEVPVTAPKSFVGNSGAGSGAVETVASVIALQKGEIPVTLNYEDSDPACPVNVVHGQPLKTDTNSALLLNQSRNGQAAAIMLVGE